MEKVSKKIGFEIIKKAFLPLVLFLTFLGFYIFYKVQIAIYMPAQFQESLKKYILTALIIIVAFILQRIAGAITAWYKVSVAAKTLTTLDDKLIPLLRKVSKLLVWVLAFLIILPLYGVNISALIATLGVGSLAVALAAQDTIANVISGFMIMVDSPFRVGDEIKLPSGEVVRVLEIGVRRSKFILEDKAVVIMPNLELSKSKIINFTYGKELANNGS